MPMMKIEFEADVSNDYVYTNEYRMPRPGEYFLGRSGTIEVANYRPYSFHYPIFRKKYTPCQKACVDVSKILEHSTTFNKENVRTKLVEALTSEGISV